MFCVFASKRDLIIAARQNPELLAEYVAVERRINFTFKKDTSLVQIQAWAASDAALPRATEYTLPCAAYGFSAKSKATVVVATTGMMRAPRTGRANVPRDILRASSASNSVLSR